MREWLAEKFYWPEVCTPPSFLCFEFGLNAVSPCRRWVVGLNFWLFGAQLAKHYHYGAYGGVDAPFHRTRDFILMFWWRTPFADDAYPVYPPKRWISIKIPGKRYAV